MKKRLFASLLCLALCLSLLPITALADGDGGVEYIERGWDGSAVTEQVETIDTYTTITSNTIQWNNGWYVAQGEVTIGTDDNPQRVTVTGDVHLILTDGCTLTVNGGIQLEAGNSLTIYGQSEQAGTMGKLTASITSENTAIYNAAIGGNTGKTGGTLTVCGGAVEATVSVSNDLKSSSQTPQGGNIYGAAIGGGGTKTGNGGNGGTATVYGGAVEATVTVIDVSQSDPDTSQGNNNGSFAGDSYGAAIGGGGSETGNGGNGGTITIFGGTVRAESSCGAGIGGGSGDIGGGGIGGNITIFGGTVRAESVLGAGIGGGSGGSGGGDGGAITISGGAVRAESYYGGGIGGGGDLSGGNTGGDGGTITISGGTVEVQSVSGAGIGGGNSGFGFSGFIQTKGTGGSGGTITISGGSVTATTMTGRSISLFSDMNEGRWAGAAIGGGIGGGGSGGTVTISGGTVEAVSTERVGIGSGGMPFYQSESPAVDQYFHCVSGKAGTFATGEDGNAMLIATGGTDHIEDDDDTSAWYGVIFLGSEGQIYGDKVTLSTDCTIPGGKQLTIGEGQSLLLDAGVTLTIDNENCITGAGTLGAGGSYQILNPLPVFTPTTLFYTGSDLSGRLSLTAPAGSVSIMGQTFTVSGTPTYRDWVITLPAGGILQVGTYTVTAYSPSQGRTVSGQITVIGDSSSTPTYSVILPGRVEGGTVTAKKSYAEEGETFRFTVTPDEGWELDTLSVTDNRGTELDVKYEGDSVYSFKMPARRVEIQVSFREIPPESLPFTDIADNAWYADAVRYVYKHGLMAGTSATTFAPDVTTSRSMIATILWRMAGSPVVNYAMTYTDVAQGQWYSEAVRWATSEGIVGGYGNGLFGTNDPITREQFAAMLYRFAQEQGYEVSIGENTNILSYTDVADLSEYAISAMQWAVGAGIINGTGDGSTLSPQGQATRAQAAVMLMRFCEEYVTW